MAQVYLGCLREKENMSINKHCLSRFLDKMGGFNACTLQLRPTSTSHLILIGANLYS